MSNEPLIKLVTKNIDPDEACDLLSKAMRRRNNHEGDGCRFDNPFMEKILQRFDYVYRDQIVALTSDIIKEMAKDVNQ